MSHERSRARRSMVSLARRFWQACVLNPGGKSLLRVERLETRDVPTVDPATSTFTGGVLYLTNTGSGDTLRLIDNGGDDLNVGSLGGGGPIKDFTGVKVIHIANDDSSPSDTFNVEVGNLGSGDLSAGGLPSLRQITFRGNVGTEGLLMGAVTNPRIYTVFNGSEGGTAGIVVPQAGVVVVNFSAPTVAATVNLDMDTATPATNVALDFRGLGTAPVQVNLNTSVGGDLATSTNLKVGLTSLTGSGTGARITGVYGSQGTNTIIGNDSGDLLIGGSGDSTLIAGNGNNQLDAVRDFSPALAGTATAGIVTYDPFTATTPIDLTQFAAISAAVATVDDASGVGGSTAAALYNAFGLFNFGKGAAALGGAAGVTSTSLNADFVTANGVTVANVTVEMFAGTGNNGFYGFGNAAVTATGRGGSDVFSSNTGGLPSEYTSGSTLGHSSLLIGSVGSTLIAGAGNDNISFVVADPTANQTLTSQVLSGTGNATIQAGFQNVVVNAGTGANKVSIGNYASNALVYNALTENLSGGLFDPTTVPLVQVAKKG